MISPERDKKYLDFVRSLKCSCCEAPPVSQAAHSNLQMHGKGKGIKACDYFTFPLCHTCHTEFDQGKKYTKQDREFYAMKWAAETMRQYILKEKNG